MGMYFCREHVRPDMRQSESVNPKLAARNRMVKAGECYVYAVDGGDLFKIGKALDVAARFSSLQSGSPIELKLVGFVLGPKTLERDIHRWAEPYRRRGEWFSKDGPVVNLVEAIRGGAVERVLALLKNNC